MSENEIDLFNYNKCPTKKRKIDSCFYQNIESDSKLSTINLEELVFTIPPQPEGVVIDLSQSKIYIKLKLCKGAEGADIHTVTRGTDENGNRIVYPPNKRCTTLNNTGPSLVDTVGFKIRQLYVKNQKYASLISYLRRLITPGTDTLDGLAGFFKLDLPGHLDKATNTSLADRYIFGTTSQEFVFDIEHPLFNQNRAFPAHHPTQIVLKLNRPEYFIWSEEIDLPSSYFGYKLEAAELHLKFLTLEPSFEKSLVTKLKNQQLHFDLNQIDTYDITLNSSTKEFTKNIFTNEIIPNPCILLILADDNLLGKCSKKMVTILNDMIYSQ